MTSQRTRERLVARLRDKGVSDPAVLEVMLKTPRHLFVDEALSSRAYEDTALPIGHGQTISQPYIVARMTELLTEGHRPARVLEVGTGCGYQSCVLAQLVERVYSVERIEALLAQARRRFRMLRLTNVRAQHSDGRWGWPEHGPYDGILATAAPERVPRALLEQLADGGRMVIPVGSQGAQHLAVINRDGKSYVQEDRESVSFVPMLGGQT
ncbi:MAG: protein-L-isoaspartate(D-aspartate) O-methyltransferase [Gammaproteobacteria bacterium]|nr:protein-L-isoaspartate(D-aspartate) O-methyltransferase [Gammaproteobacteria bacterium]NIR32897.1 protein-L-isoaspartate(D-aspartate) O-methyltransferase [Gammaproteobacteria bacterium]NIR99443.1 protein-L-isoaspartate(D-aspartate) O-methyltransferase [Gammaproteobacteria bacterium]NIT65057.1 protein-L-isoaspartate(D-aspartate) O-methyltransferase [Gammaproteobacteria bacterium]NIV21972.1 protein-L-isoaspartate(D-aspartate) O-methyltransferase [Gammaproteobacteria bacterium]